MIGAAVVLALGCTDDGAGGDDSDGESDDTDVGTDDTDGTDGSETSSEGLRPNWHQDVAPLVTEACQGCHLDGGIGPFSMESYEETSPWAALMADEVEAGLMPPWHAIETEVCTPPLAFKHDPRLPAESIQMLRDWADIGAPEGDPADAVELPEPPDLDLAGPDVTTLMQGSVEIEAQGPALDFFHCVSLDPGNDQDVFLTGLQVIPGNPEVVHHVLVYVDEDAQSASWDNGVLENCGGGSGISGAPLVSGWVPGSLPMEPPDGVGINLPAGSRLILNVHYHATGGGVEVDDATGMALRWTTAQPSYASFFTLLGAPGVGQSQTGPLMIPAGAKDHVESYTWTVSDNGAPFPDSIDARIWAVVNHMHKVGVDIRAWVESEGGEETCLLHTPQWDFDWQRIYEYDAPITEAIRVRAGDVIHIECAYDNSLDNPALVEALAEVGLEAPVDVGLGEGTLDEMCLTGLGVGVGFAP